MSVNVCVAGTGAGRRKCRKVFESRITQHHRGKGWVGGKGVGREKLGEALYDVISAEAYDTTARCVSPLARTPSVVVVVVPNDINEGATINEG